VSGGDPLKRLGAWIEEARATGLPEPASVAFVTVDGSGRPSARTVTLKRIEDGALLFTTALWTRKARDLRENPKVALLFHWPALGRQVQVGGEIAWGSRALAEELYAERGVANQYQTLVSRQGEPIDDLEPLRDRLAHLHRVAEAPPSCPPDWGALHVVPDFAEFWTESPDRLHDRLAYTREPGGGWRETRVAP
jgi:pyridoxamine 5'-phosphate oxidase